MKSIVCLNKRIILDAVFFWGFWILLTGLLIGMVERTIGDAARAIVALIIPQIVPVSLINYLFTTLFIRGKAMQFFLLSIPLWIMSGFLINVWFDWLMTGVNMHANNVFILLIFTLLYIGFNHIRLAFSQRILLKDEENKRVLSELQYLRTQLNPHFLFNALNSIYSLILSKSDKAGEAVMALSEIMRFHLDLSGKQLIRLSDELALMESYIALEKLKFESRCEIGFLIQGDPDNLLIAPLIFLPFLENAFKHGISVNPTLNFVNAEIQVAGSTISVTITNSIPVQVPENTRGNKLGIENTLKRLELHYRGQYTYTRTITENNFQVSITIHLNLQE